jgi:diguanylate cyclase (GGDEF)-like protein/PAS domain S-box-containing protein
LKPALRRLPAWLGTLKVRLLLLWAALMAACLLGATVTVLQRVERRSVNAVMDLQAEHVSHLAGVLSQRVMSMQRTLRLVAQRLDPGALADPRLARETLLAHTALASMFDTTFVADARGRVMAMQTAGIASTPQLHLDGREYFIRTVTQGVPVVSSPIVGRLSKGTVVTFTMPVFDATQRVVGVIGGAMRLAERNLLDDLTYGTRASLLHTVVTDAHGTIVSHPDRSRVGTAVEQDPLLAAAAARWAAQGRPVEPSALVERDSGQFVSTAGVAAADWVLFNSVSEGQLLGDMNLARREALALAGAVALGASLFMLGALAVLLRPLRQLRNRALRIHDPSLPPDEGWPHARGEIGDLSRVLRQAQAEGQVLDEERQHAMQRMRSVMASAPIGIAFTRERRFELVSAEFCALLGWQEAELTGRAASTIFASEREYAELGPHVAAAFAADRPFGAEMQFRRRDGHLVWCLLQGRPVDGANASAGTIWLLEDVTERRAERERLSWSASHDMLTRLLNRAAFEARLQACLAEGDTPAALLLIDLDRFKQVNDNAGHAAGDDVLRQVAAVLHDHVRGADAAARLGGDEFALLLPRCESADALALAQRLVLAIGQCGVKHDGQWLGVGASIGVAGVALASHSTSDPAAALARADAALYEAKRAGRGRAVLAREALPLQLVG